MALKDEFADTGGWLFRWRSYLPLAFLPLLVASLSGFADRSVDETWGQGWEVLCILVAWSGLALRAAALGRTPHRTSGRNTLEQVADSLNTTGLYSVVRHPLYVGNFLSWLGVAMFPQSPMLLLVAVLAFALYYERIMFAEERFLAGKFGESFREWAARTPAFVPRPSLWQPSSRPFSWKVVLRREYSGMFATVCTFTVLHVLRGWFERGWIRLEWPWALFLAAGTAAYLALRHAKKSGRLPLPD